MTTRQKLKNKLEAANRDYYDAWGHRKGYRGFPPVEEERRMLFGMNFGSERRKKLEEWFKTGETLHVNRHYCPNLRYDSDLCKMLKQGILKRVREGRTSKSCGTRRTVLSLA